MREVWRIGYANATLKKTHSMCFEHPRAQVNHRMDAKVLEAARAAFPPAQNQITLGAVVHSGEHHPEPVVSIPIPMMNRHGLIAGATGTGKTRTLQLIAEQLSL